jgi:Ca-activated chloride channel family protein
MHDPFRCIVGIGLALLTGVAALAAPAAASQIELEADLGQSVLHRTATKSVYLRLSLKGLGSRDRERRPPVNVALVIDRSGSMQGERIAAAKEGARVALERLSAHDIVSLIAYNHEVDVLAPAGRLDDGHLRLEKAISRLTADGTTALYAGVREGGAQVRKFRSDTQVNRVILLSDGLANVGPSSPRELADLGRELASKGITVSTIGLGLEYNEDLMQRLAAASDGNHVFVERPSDLAEIFDREFGDALSISAQDLTITIECRLGFKPVRVLGREADMSGSRVTLKMNQLQADHERYVILELAVPERPVTGNAEVADIAVDYVDIDTGSRAKAQASVRAQFSEDEKEATGSVDKAVMTQVTEQIATENSEKAVELRDRGDIAGARRILDDNAAFLSQQKRFVTSGPAPAPAAAAKALDELERKSREAAANLDGESWGRTRKSMRYDQHKSKVQQAY